MFLNRKWLITLTAMTVVFLLSACGRSTESKLIGSWKVVTDNKIISYLEIGEKRLIVRSQSNDTPMTAEYIITETQDGNFIIEAINPEKGSAELLFECHFENKNNITILNTPNGPAKNSTLVRVDNISKEKEAEEKRIQEEKEKELAKAEEKRRQQELENERLREEEKKRQEQIAKENQERAAKQLAAEANSAKKKYLQKSDQLDNEIISEAQKLYGYELPTGFYGQYYKQWDDLLNDIWKVLKETMPKETFEKLKTDQIQWVQMKEKNFAEIPNEPASERARGMDYLAFETKYRTYYLIENYMD